MIELVRIHPMPPLYAASVEDSQYYESTWDDDPERSASNFAWEHGLDVGESVWLGWGKLPPSEEGREFDVAYVEEWVVLWVDDDGVLAMPATLDF